MSCPKDCGCEGRTILEVTMPRKCDGGPSCPARVEVTACGETEPTYVCGEDPRKPRTFARRRLRVYVAGPISSDVFDGVWRGFAAGKRMFQDGLAPFIPHADAFWFLGETYWNAYLEYDLEYVAVCDAVFRLDGESKGADLECDVAASLGIPVFTEDRYGALLQYAADQELRGVRR